MVWDRMSGRVFRYRRRPSRRLIGLGVFIWLIGVAGAVYWRAPERRLLPGSKQRAAASLAVSGWLGGCVLIWATAHLWFPHLRKRTR